jgi:hypothetical protein
LIYSRTVVYDNPSRATANFTIWRVGHVPVL